MKLQCATMHLLIAPVAALALFVSACSGSEEATKSPAASQDASSLDPSTQGTPSKESSTNPSEQPSQTSGASSTTSELSSQGRAAVDAFLKSHEGATEIPASQLDPSVTSELAESFTVEPAKCQNAMQAASDPKFLEGAGMGGAVLQDSNKGSAISLVVYSFGDSSGPKNILEAGRANVQQCPQFTIEVSGQKVTATLKITEVEIAGADDAYLLESTQAAEGGLEQTMYTGVAMKGNLQFSAAAQSLDGSVNAEAITKILGEAVAAAG